MAFKIVSDPQFTTKIRVAVPVTNGHTDQNMIATFRVLTTDKVAEFDLNSNEGSNDFLRAVIVRLDDIEGEDGQPASWNDELRDQLIVIPYVRAALSRGYFEGVVKARSGN